VYANSFIQLIDDSPQLRATSGIAYYTSPPHTIKEAVLDPIHMGIYITFIISACALFSETWIEVSGSGPRDGFGVLGFLWIFYDRSFLKRRGFRIHSLRLLTVGKNCTRQLQMRRPPYGNLQLWVLHKIPIAIPVGRDVHPLPPLLSSGVEDSDISTSIDSHEFAKLKLVRSIPRAITLSGG
jgi:hypothetical protein